MALTDAIETIEASYAEGSPWPPRAFNAFALRSQEYSAAFGREHDADGTHNHVLLAHGGAVVHQYGGSFFAYTQGMDVVRESTGIYRILLWTPMRSSVEWGVVAKVNRMAVTGQTGGGGTVVELGPSHPLAASRTKTDKTTWIRVVSDVGGVDAKEFDPVSLTIHAYGRRRAA